MKVYVLFHADIEDDRYLRGVYARREDAEADVSVNEAWGKPESPYRRRHGDWCCSVDEEEVLEPAELPQHGPFATERIDPNATGLVRMDLGPMIERLVAAQFPAWENLVRERK